MHDQRDKDTTKRVMIGLFVERESLVFCVDACAYAEVEYHATVQRPCCIELRRAAAMAEAFCGAMQELTLPPGAN